MAKVNILTLQNLDNRTTAVQQINQNFAAIQTAMENTFSRNGAAPNQLASTLDMNFNRILNLPPPILPTDAARLSDVQPGPTGPKGDKGDTGETGPRGPTGPQGAIGLNIKGELANTGELPTPPDDPNDAYLISGDLYVWDSVESAWVDAGPIQGPQGEEGPAGPAGPTGATGPAGATGPEGPAGTNSASLPVGSVLFSPTGSVPSGFLACEGSTFDQAVYPALYSYLGTNVLPDMRNRVLRHSGSLAGSSGGTQEDAFQGHIHENSATSFVFQTGSGGGRPAPDNDGPIKSNSSDPISDGMNGEPRTASETRVKAYIGKFIIKAYDVFINEDQVDLVAMEQSLADVVADLADVVADVAALPVQTSYTSDPEEITAAGLVTITHSLGSAPKQICMWLECDTTNLGYAVGDRVYIGDGGAIGDGGGTSNGFSSYTESATATTTLYIRVASTGFQLPNKTTGVVSAATVGSWTLIVGVYA